MQIEEVALSHAHMPLNARHNDGFRHNTCHMHQYPLGQCVYGMCMDADTKIENKKRSKTACESVWESSFDVFRQSRLDNKKFAFVICS